MSPVRVLFVSPRKAWPPTSGARLRDLHFARSLAGRFCLSYLYFGGEEDATETGLQIRSFSAKSIPLPSKYTLGKVIRGLYGRTPLPVLNYTSPEMVRAIENVLGQGKFDIVHLDSLHLAAYLPTIRRSAPNALTVLDWHNIESELMKRYATSTASAVKRAYAWLTARQLNRLERTLLSECSGHVVCSERERSLLAARNPRARIAMIENGVDTKRFRPPSSDGENNITNQKLVFVGQMSYHANVEAACWFVRDIWPAVHAHFPDLKLSIVGSEPTPAVLSLATPNSVEVTGTVPDILPFYQNAFASIVPLRTGGGTRLKILEAMAAGTPVISTEAGAEGLRVANGENIQIVNNDPQSWITALSSLRNVEARSSQTDKGRKLVCTHYDWENIGGRLAATYEGWLQDDLQRSPGGRGGKEETEGAENAKRCNEASPNTGFNQSVSE